MLVCGIKGPIRPLWEMAWILQEKGNAKIVFLLLLTKYAFCIIYMEGSPRRLGFIGEYILPTIQVRLKSQFLIDIWNCNYRMMPFTCWDVFWSFQYNSTLGFPVVFHLNTIWSSRILKNQPISHWQLPVMPWNESTE